mmetsp:Transcript_84876/g.181859  ORF Transcript_84876/g.181859 Transcript_84876/m.181859 type:complete len:364 (+) Transcript_84876:560-1651(+)
MLLDLYGHHSQVRHLFVGSRPLHLILRHGRDRLRAAALFVDHLNQLRAHRPSNDRRLAHRQGWLEDVPLVGVHRAAHDCLAESVGTRDEDDVAKAALRVQGEHNAGGPGLAAHHLLASGAELHLFMLEASIVAVGDGPIREQGCEDEVHLRFHILVAHDIEVGLLLAGEGSVGEVLSSSRGAHGEGERLAAAAHTLPLLLQFSLEVRLERRVHDLVANLLADLHQLVHICVDRLVAECVIDECVDTALVEELLVGVGGGAEATRHRHADLRKLGNHFTQGSTLPANFVHIGVAELLERDARAGVHLPTTGLACRGSTARRRHKAGCARTCMSHTAGGAGVKGGSSKAGNGGYTAQRDTRRNTR